MRRALDSGEPESKYRLKKCVVCILCIVIVFQETIPITGNITIYTIVLYHQNTMYEVDINEFNKVNAN